MPAAFDPVAISRVWPAADEGEHLALAAMDAAEGGRITEADRLARQALTVAEGLCEGRERERLLTQALRALGSAQRARGHYREAERTFARALANAFAAFGNATLEVAELQNDLGMTYKYLGRFAEAEAAYALARAILEGLPDADPEDLAALFHNLGGLAHARGDLETAEPLARRAVEIRSASVGPRAPATLLDRSAHAAILAGLGRADDAEASIQDLLGDLEAVLGSEHPEVAIALNNLAAILQTRGALVEAESIYRRVIAIKGAQLGLDSATLAVPLNNLATVLRAQGRPAEAAALYDRATTLLEGMVRDDHPNLLAIRRNAARLAADGARSAWTAPGQGSGTGPNRVSRGQPGKAPASGKRGVGPG
jgi:tetratricopeptide (TPR) repeat protein